MPFRRSEPSACCGKAHRALIEIRADVDSNHDITFVAAKSPQHNLFGSRRDISVGRNHLPQLMRGQSFWRFRITQHASTGLDELSQYDVVFLGDRRRRVIGLDRRHGATDEAEREHEEEGGADGHGVSVARERGVRD